jgi:hypothetical protein
VQQCREQILALAEWQRAQLDAIPVQQIECEHRELVVLSRAQS